LVVSKSTKLKILSSSLIVVSCLLSASSVAHPDAKGVVKERMVTMKALASSMKALNQVKSGKMPIAASSKISEKIIEKIIELSKLIPKQFPAGTYSFPSEASPKIDSDRARFERIAEKLREAASTIPKIAQAGDLEKFKSSFREIGKTCSACHKAFRV
jgi:cytochrome c556